MPMEEWSLLSLIMAYLTWVISQSTQPPFLKRPPLPQDRHFLALGATVQLVGAFALQKAGLSDGVLTAMNRALIRQAPNPGLLLGCHHDLPVPMPAL